MPSQESSHRFEKAVLFPRTGVDGYGKYVVGDAEEIQVRWTVTPSERVDKETNATVISGKCRVNRDVLVGSRIFQGTMDEWLGTGTGANDNMLMDVTVSEKTPDLKARFHSRVLTVMRHMDSNG